jgi:hypothetical protein
MSPKSELGTRIWYLRSRDGTIQTASNQISLRLNMLLLVDLDPRS